MRPHNSNHGHRKGASVAMGLRRAAVKERIKEGRAAVKETIQEGRAAHSKPRLGGALLSPASAGPAREAPLPHLRQHLCGAQPRHRSRARAVATRARGAREGGCSRSGLITSVDDVMNLSRHGAQAREAILQLLRRRQNAREGEGRRSPSPRPV